MKTATLKLETPALLPGLREEFDQQMESLVADCKRRPGLSKVRKLKLEIEVKPTTDDADDVWIQPMVSSSRPGTAIDRIRGRRTRTGQLQFDFEDADEG